MDNTVLITAVIVAFSQLGYAMAAWKLARSHEARLDDHEIRIRVVEAEVK